MTTQKIAELGFNIETGQFSLGLQKISADTSKAVSNMLNNVSQLANGFENQFKKASASSQNLNKGLDNVSIKIKEMLAGLAYFVGVSSVIGSATKATTELHDAMIDISKLGDFTPQGLKNLKQDLKDLSQEIPLTTYELAKIAESGVQAGFPNDEISKFVELTGKASSALGLIPEETADNLGKISSAFGGMPLDRIRKLADSVNYLEDSVSNVKSKDLLEVLQRSAGAGQLAKLTEQQLGALGASLLSVGTNVEVAGSSINSFLGSLSAVQVQSAPFKDTMKALGFDLKKFAELATKDGQGAILSILERLKQLDDVSRNNAIANLFGKGEDAQAVAKLVLNLDRYKDTLQKVSKETNYLGNINKAAQKDQEKFSTQLATMKNTLANIGTTIMSVVEPTLASMLKGINSVVKSIGEFTKQHPNIMATAGALVALGATTTSILALKSAFTALGAVRLVGLIGQITGLTATIGLLRGALTALATHPAFIVISATAAVGYGIYKGVQSIREQAKQRDNEDKNNSFLDRRNNYGGLYGIGDKKRDQSKYGAEESRLYNSIKKVDDSREIQKFNSQAKINQEHINNIPKTKESIPSLGADNKSGSSKKDSSKDKIDLVEQYEKELQIRKDYLDKQNAINNTFFAYSLQDEADFWKNKEKYVKGDDLIKISRKTSELQIQANKEKFDAEIETLEQGLNKFRNNYEQREKIAEQIHEKIANKYGKESPQAKKALYNVQQETESKDKQNQEVEDIKQSTKDSSDLYDIEKQEQLAQQSLELEKITQQQFLDLQQQFLDKKTQIELKALEEKQTRLAKDPDANPKELEQLYAEKLALLKNYEKQKRDIEFKSQVEKQKIEKKFKDATEQGMANSIKGLITLQMGWRDAMRNILDSMLQAVANHISQVMAQNLIAFAFGTQLKRKEMIQDAYKAATGAYSAVAKFAPPLAPIAAAGAFAGTMVFANSIPSAKGGWDIPSGLNPMTQLHEREMVLPAKYADVIRSFDGNTSNKATVVYNDHSGKLSPQDIKRNVATIAKALVEFQKGKK